MYTNIMTGSPNPTSYIPNIFLKYTDKMSFLERFVNFFVWMLDEFYIRFDHFPRQKKLYEKYFPDAETSFEDQRKNISLLFNNNYFASSTVKPGMPNIVDIGGIHVEAAKPLPKLLQEFLDSASDGAILFSMGSIIQAVQWEAEKREAFVKAFGKLKQKVLWKYENKTLPHKPQNVMIGSWIPQRDILAHPNVKLFITHGGLLGTSEALVEGVPVLGIPIFGDQTMNMNTAIGKGYAQKLKYHEISEEYITKMIKKVFNNQEIRSKAKAISQVYTDRPLSPQQTVLYWVDYVIRHNGAKHLRPAGLELNYFQFHSIDIYASIFILISLFFTTCRFCVKMVLTKCFSGKRENKKKIQ